MTSYRFLEPVDVLFLRGNKLFGDAPGSYGDSLIPPWPSVAAGAIRSHILACDGIDLGAFARGEIRHPVLGTPEDPGGFVLRMLTLARRNGTGVNSLHPLPADLVAVRDPKGALGLNRLVPRAIAPALMTSSRLPRIAVLPADDRAKPVTGVWLGEHGWRRYLDGGLPEAASLVESRDLWRLEERIGVGLDPATRRAEDGKLFTAQAIRLARDHGFLAGVDGAEPPAEGTVRLGGDGRAAALHAVDYRPPEVDHDRIAAAGRCRIVLTSPGIFAGGWRPTGCDDEGRFALGGVSARLVCAAVGRAEVASGWDLARARPKPAVRTAPSGSVYWLENLQASPDALRALAERGLWPDGEHDAQRRAEGFNRFTFAVP